MIVMGLNKYSESLISPCVESYIYFDINIFIIIILVHELKQMVFTDTFVAPKSINTNEALKSKVLNSNEMELSCASGTSSERIIR